MSAGATRPYPVEEFLQALTAQLDRAQDALSLKVTGTNRPLTWALKDLSLELRVFVEINDGGKVVMRSAGPNEQGASTVHLGLTTITRPMVEENSYAFQKDADPRSMEDFRAASNLDESDQRKLDWMGIRTVGQLRNLDPLAVQAVMGIPVNRLQAALQAAARPTVTHAEPAYGPAGLRQLRIHGANLSDGVNPEVRLAGSPVEVIHATPRQLLVQPLTSHQEGQVEVFTAGQRATGYFRISPHEIPNPPASPAAAGAP